MQKSDGVKVNSLHGHTFLVNDELIPKKKKKFILWRQIIKEDKILRHTKLYENVFSQWE